MSNCGHVAQEQRQVAAEEAGKAKQAAQQLLTLAHSTGKVTEAYEVILLHNKIVLLTVVFGKGLPL